MLLTNLIYLIKIKIVVRYLNYFEQPLRMFNELIEMIKLICIWWTDLTFTKAKQIIICLPFFPERYSCRQDDYMS